MATREAVQQLFAGGANHNVSVINGNTNSGLFHLWQSAGNIDVSLGGAHGALAAQVYLVPGPRVWHVVWWVAGSWVQFPCLMGLWFRCIFETVVRCIFDLTELELSKSSRWRLGEGGWLSSPKQTQQGIVKAGTVTSPWTGLHPSSNHGLPCRANTPFIALQNLHVLYQEPASLHFLFSKKFHFISRNNLCLLDYANGRVILCFPQSFHHNIPVREEIVSFLRGAPLAISIKPIDIFMNSENDNISWLWMNIISVEKNPWPLCKGRWSIVVLLELFERARWEKRSAWCGVCVSKSLKKVFFTEGF